MSDRVGQQLGNYRLIGRLGQGAFADVYLGEHLHLKHHAAIKVLHTRLQDQEAENFLREAQLLVSLRHPHIVRIFDFAIEHEVPFLVMEYAAHGSLRTCHPKDTFVPLETVLSYVKQIAPAIHYIHERKLIHRDIKPENILVNADDELLLSDFGIASIAHTTGSLVIQGQAGTPPYMAPEQILKKPRPASDQYALGIMVYEWLCGTRPFQGAILAIIQQHLSAPPPSLSERNPKIPSNVESVVLKALAKDPQQRFATLPAFAAALEQASQSPTAPQPLMIVSLPSPPSLPPDTISARKQPIPTVESEQPSSQPSTSTATSGQWSQSPTSIPSSKQAQTPAYTPSHGSPLPPSTQHSPTLNSLPPLYQPLSLKRELSRPPGGASYHTPGPQASSRPTSVLPPDYVPEAALVPSRSLPSSFGPGCLWGMVQGLLAGVLVAFTMNEANFIVAILVGFAFYVLAGFTTTWRGGGALRGAWAGFWAGIISTFMFWIVVGVCVTIRIIQYVQLARYRYDIAYAARWVWTHTALPQSQAGSSQSTWGNLLFYLGSGLAVALAMGWVGGLMGSSRYRVSIAKKATIVNQPEMARGKAPWNVVAAVRSRIARYNHNREASHRRLPYRPPERS